MKFEVYFVSTELHICKHYETYSLSKLIAVVCFCFF